MRCSTIFQHNNIFIHSYVCVYLPAAFLQMYLAMTLELAGAQYPSGEIMVNVSVFRGWSFGENVDGQLRYLDRLPSNHHVENMVVLSLSNWLFV